jgi:hypothetical protein
MVEKMTAVWLIILTIIVCAAVPSLMIWLTTSPHPKMLLSVNLPVLDQVFVLLQLR